LRKVSGIDKTSRLIQQLKGEPDLRLLCGFDKVPCKATFSTVFDALIKSARETVKKNPAKKDAKQAKKHGEPAK